jgi:hypothetical protein
MRGRLFTVAAAISLLLCIATVALWVRSYWRQDHVIREVHYHPAWFHDDPKAVERDLTQELQSSDGILDFEWQRYLPQIIADEQNPVMHWDFYSTRDEERSTDDFLRSQGMLHGVYVGRFGVAWGDGFYGWQVELAVPHWLVALLALVSPATWLLRYRRRRARRMQGRCLRCGFDLRASPDRCPECGTPIPLKAEATA